MFKGWPCDSLWCTPENEVSTTSSWVNTLSTQYNLPGERAAWIRSLLKT